ncbi:MAG: hypothetical protein AAF914_13975, partial [Pseudomonadota bacterium]
TDSDTTIATISAGDTLDAALIGDPAVSIVAEFDGPVGSVIFTMGDWTQTENFVPYALFGDRNGDFDAGDAAPFADAGDYTLDIEWFAGPNGTGGRLGEHSATFSIEDPAPVDPPADPAPVDPPADPDPMDPPADPDPVEPPADPDPVEPPADPGPPPPPTIPDAPPPAASQLWLVDTEDNEELLALGEKTIVHEGLVSGRPISVAAEIDESRMDVESARMSLDGRDVRVENVEPYALFGDLSRDYLGGMDLEAGDAHDIGVRYFGADRARGPELGTDTLRLEVQGAEMVGEDGVDDLFAFDPDTLGAARITGFEAGDRLAAPGSDHADLMSAGSWEGDDWVIRFGGGNRLTLEDLAARQIAAEEDDLADF